PGGVPALATDDLRRPRRIARLRLDRAPDGSSAPRGPEASQHRLRPRRCRSRAGRKRFTEPVALSSTASIDFPPSGLAAFRVQPLETTSTYSRSVLGAGANLAIPGAVRQNRRD